MKNRQLQKWIARVALLAIMLATLVPTLSLAFPMQHSKSFIQEVCSSQGSKLIIQVVTTQGKLRSTLIDFNPEKKPASISHHLNHCPFCHIAAADIILPPHNPAYILFQQTQSKLALGDYNPPVVFSYTPSAHRTRAPPSTQSA